MAIALISFQQLVTGWVQFIYYGITIRAGDPKPQPGSLRFMKHRRRIHTLVIISYLFYTIYEAHYQIQRSGDFYRELGIRPDADDRGIKLRYRRLATMYHPDKQAFQDTSGSSEARFVQLKLAQDTLLDPVKRFAYDRFGPDILAWKHCSSIYDYLSAGFQAIAPYYAGTAFIMILMGIIGFLERGRYWRYVTFFALLLFESHTLTRPYFPPLTVKIINPILARFTAEPPYLPFQQLILARKVVVTLFIAFSQLGPVLQEAQASSQPSNKEESLLQQLNRLEQATADADEETSRLLALDMAPFANDEQALKDIRVKLKEFLVQNTIRSDPEVRDLLGQVLKKRRVGAPAGAKGMR
ncbi:MAG: hypothetical protein M1829_006388 [Trizodia sp. TS-e1964]|nr:MAG: hypothetical protein M1829_006388 [Trizodia sp. TS-e1964]